MKKTSAIFLIIILSIAIIAYTDLVLRPGYLVKTMVKLPVFLLAPMIYSLFFKNFKPLSLIKPSTNGFKSGTILGILIYIAVVACYLISNSFADLSSIRTSLENNLGINKDNFFLVGLYVCVVNSFLEEWFFRGFVFLQLKQQSRVMAYIVSSTSFAVYHIAIMDGMFNVALFIVVLLGLFIGGCIFNYLNEKNNNIYASWLCHFFANLAMNTVGYMLFF